jgi:hypothetical protein
VTGSISAQDATVARVECTDAVMRFFGHYDRREYPQMYALMTPDGVWNRPDGAARVGPELEASMAKRSANLAVVHVVTNLVTDVTALDRANVHGLMTVYRDDNGKLSPGPAKLSGPGSIIAFTMGFAKLGSAWRIHTIDIAYLFKA